jgi:cell division protein FtsW
MIIDKQHFKGNELWVIMVWLGIIGLFAVYSTTERIGSASPTTYLVKHLGFLVCGFVVAYGISRIPTVVFRNTAVLIFVAVCALVLYMQIYGIRHHIPAIRTIFGIQPAEFAKIGIIMYVARSLAVLNQKEKSNEMGRIKNFKCVFSHIILPVLIACGLIFLSNFSTSAILFLTCCVLMLLGNVRFKHIALTTFVLAVMLAIGMWLAHSTTDYCNKMRKHGEKVEGFWAAAEKACKATRLNTMANRTIRFMEHIADYSSGKKDKPAIEHQIDYAQLAIATGGIAPTKGPGNSEVKYILPEAFSDFVFAIIVEEYGIILTTVFVLLIFFAILPWRIGVLAKKLTINLEERATHYITTHYFAIFLIIGIGLQITFQTLAHVGVSIGFLPVTGQNLPLISQGGSSVISISIMFGLLLNVRRYITLQEQKAVVSAVEPLANTISSEENIENL